MIDNVTKANKPAAWNTIINNNYILLPTLGGYPNGKAIGISPDGSAIVGTLTDGTHNIAVIWTVGGGVVFGPTQMPDLAGFTGQMTAYGVANGIAVGMAGSTGSLGSSHLVYWSNDYTTVNDFGVKTSPGAMFYSGSNNGGRGISPDARMLLGSTWVTGAYGQPTYWGI